MGKSEYKTDKARALGEINAALFELRDALTELSISLKDWQFATDVVRRRENETAVQQLLQKLNTSN
jgi:hypothetical protein